VQKISIQNQDRPNQRACSSLPTALELVSALTPQQHLQLNDFAANRIMRLATTSGNQRLLSALAPGDAVNAAIEMVLLGDQQPQMGRKLSKRNRTSTESFVACLCGMINNNLVALADSAEALIEHLPLHQVAELCVDSLETDNPTEQLGAVDREFLTALFFSGLVEKERGAADSSPIIEMLKRGELSRDFILKMRDSVRENLAGLQKENEPSIPNEIGVSI
jgi:hypothetical protein